MPEQKAANDNEAPEKKYPPWVTASIILVSALCTVMGVRYGIYWIFDK